MFSRNRNPIWRTISPRWGAGFKRQDSKAFRATVTRGDEDVVSKGGQPNEGEILRGHRVVEHRQVESTAPQSCVDGGTRHRVHVHHEIRVRVREAR